MAEQYEGKPHHNEAPVSAADEGGPRMSIVRYLVTRISTLKPPMNPAPNPLKALTLLNKQQWLFFLVS